MRSDCNGGKVLCPLSRVAAELILQVKHLGRLFVAFSCLTFLTGDIDGSIL